MTSSSSDARRSTRLGYEDAGLEPEHVHGTVVLRGKPIEVNDTLVYLVKGPQRRGPA